ncbi:pyridoxal-phosphate dependent enzyme [Flavobacteriaceae bacterium Ap0902]|nr:pyridoxal-phosphate dependent enzyme [Flavobacteriaceae bacterium Ap0902]
MKIQKINSSLILDENLNNSFISGNKYRKVKAIIEDEKETIQGIISFGSKYSSHILACAWWSKLLEIPFIGVIIDNNDIILDNYPHLKMSRNFGANLIKTKSDIAYSTIENWKGSYPNYKWIPGGAHTLEAARSYENLFDEIIDEGLLKEIKKIILPYGTGTTAYGIWKSIIKHNLDIEVIGVSVSRDKKHCFEAIKGLENINFFKNLKVIDTFSNKYDYTDSIIEGYRWRFFNETGILPDPIYNSKVIYHYYENKMKDTLIINTGGMLNNLLTKI